MNPGQDPPSVTVYPDGPLVLRGAFDLRTADGQRIDSARNVVALCRCGRSRVKPLCDGSHKLVRFVDSASAEDVSRAVELALPFERPKPAQRGTNDA
jgi:CDGSH-type Zn-finger protein